jgi:hypothetical protein
MQQRWEGNIKMGVKIKVMGVQTWLIWLRIQSLVSLCVYGRPNKISESKKCEGFLTNPATEFLKNDSVPRS